MRQTLLSLLALALMLVPHRADAWSSSASNTHYKIVRAHAMIEQYRADTGKLPDAQNCWNSIRKDFNLRFHGQPDPFLDDWKRELVYRNPGTHLEFDIYSFGADGIDDQGKNDDISGWNGVNEGYYWKRLWPLGRSAIIASCVIGFVLVCARRRIPRELGRPLAGLVITLGVAFGCFLLLHPGVVPSRNGPLSLVTMAAGILSILFLIRVWRNFRHFKR